MFSNDNGKSHKRHYKTDDVIISKHEIYIDVNKAQSENGALMLAGGEMLSDMTPDQTQPEDATDGDMKHRLHFVKYVKRNGRTVKLWECGACAREFQHQYTLMRHLPTHTDVRNYQCTQCNKAFRQLSTLSQHKAIHSMDRPYECEVCHKSFNRISTLISHRKTHSDYKPYRCNVCNRGFHQKGNLRNHIFTHTNERPYKCTLCHKGFNQMSNLVCHKIKVHTEGPPKSKFRCSFCEREFSKQGQLQSHEMKKHGIMMEKKEPAAQDKEMVKKSTEERESESSTSDECVVVDRICTKAMERALNRGFAPFLLIRSATGHSAFAKVIQIQPHDKHMLVPVNCEELRGNNLLSVYPQENTDQESDQKEKVIIHLVASATVTFSQEGFQLKIEEPSDGNIDLDTRKIRHKIMEALNNTFPNAPEVFGEEDRGEMTYDGQNQNIQDQEEGYSGNYMLSNMDMSIDQSMMNNEVIIENGAEAQYMRMYDANNMSHNEELNHLSFEEKSKQEMDMLNLMTALQNSGYDPNSPNIEMVLNHIEIANAQQMEQMEAIHHEQ